MSVYQPTRVLCPHCGRYVDLQPDRGGAAVAQSHDWHARGIRCPGARLTWAEIERAHRERAPVTVPVGLPPQGPVPS